MYRPETIVEALVEAWNTKPPSAIAGLFGANGRIHARSALVLGIGNSAVRDVFESLRDASCGGVLRVTGMKAVRIGERSRLLRAQWVMSGVPLGVAVFCGCFTVLVEWKERRWQISAMDLEDLTSLKERTPPLGCNEKDERDGRKRASQFQRSRVAIRPYG